MTTFSSSSSSSSDELEQFITECDDEHQIMGQHILNNNIIVANIIGSQAARRHGGSVPGHRVIHRDREGASHRLFNDYFSENPTFNEDATDEYINIGESTTIKCVKKFCRSIVEIYSDQYLRSPTASDVARLLYIGQQRGFPGMLGSLDCMHWKWKNCPTGWAGSYAGRSGFPSIILEVVADYDLWIWHAFFGMPGSNNDINVLERSSLFGDLARGITPPAHYVIKGKEYNVGYYLDDGIYPKWSTLVQTLQEPRTAKKKHFAKQQESCRKDVERAFGVLQSRFAIVANPTRYWKKKHLDHIMKTCIIMHNMIIENERDLSAPIEDTREVPTPDIEMISSETCRYQSYFARYKKMKDKMTHFALRDALIDHMWEEYSNSENYDV